MNRYTIHYTDGSYETFLTQRVTTEDLDGIADSFQGLPGVEDVTFVVTVSVARSEYAGWAVLEGGSVAGTFDWKADAVDYARSLL